VRPPCLFSYQVDACSDGAKLLWKRNLMDSTSFKVVTGNDRKSVPLGVNDHKVPKDVHVLNLFAVFSFHELYPGLPVRVISVCPHDTKVLFGIGVGQDVVMVLRINNRARKIRKSSKVNSE